MGENVSRTIGRVIESMQENLGEQLTLDDMARTAMYSKFHFARVFRETTGVSPGRYLSAMRLQEAKRLLICSSLNVADISTQVGYSSVGTFCSRFKSSVGITPAKYRQLGGLRRRQANGDRKSSDRTGRAVVKGRIWPAKTAQPGPIYIGLFPGWIPDGPPVRCAALRDPGPYILTDVPYGTWHLLVCSISIAAGREVLGDRANGDQAPMVGAHGPITVRPGRSTIHGDIRLRPMGVLDPPVLLAMLDVQSVELRITA